MPQPVSQGSLGFLYGGVLCLLLTCLCGIQVAQAVDASQLTPPTLSDGSGNSADHDSRIDFAKSVADSPPKPMKCSECVGDGAIRSFLDTAKGFAQTVIEGDTYDLTEKVAKDGMKSLLDDKEEVIKDHIGFIICIGIGLLFTLIFPIVGCCFACCRCSGKCGGSRRTDGRPKEGNARTCLGISLFFLTTLVLVGGVMALVTNSYMSGSLKSAHDDTPENVDTLKSFLVDFTEDIRGFTSTDLNFTRNVIFRDLDNLGFIFGNILKENLKSETKNSLDAIKDSVGKMDAAFISIKEILPRINDQIGHVKGNMTEYANAMSDIKTDYDDAMTAAGQTDTAPGIDTSIDSSQLTDLDGVSEMENVGNLTDKFENSLKEIDDIPERVQNESTNPVRDLKASIMDYTASADKTVDDLDIADKLETDDIKTNVKDYTEIVMKYDNYRMSGGLALSLVVVLIAVLLFLGLGFGFLGSSVSTLPHRRGCASNSGGNLLIAAVALTFLFGWVLMLLTTILFTIGSPLENYACKPLRDPGFLDKLLDKLDVFGKPKGTGTILGEKLLDDPNENLTISDLLSACKNNEGIYKALRINESKLFNISEILNYKSKFSVKDDLSLVNVDFDKIKIMTPQLENNLHDFNNSIQYDFNKYTTELTKDPAKAAEDFKTDLQDNPSTTPAVKSIQDSTVAQIDGVVSAQGENLKNSMSVLSSQLVELTNVLTPPSKPSVSDELDSMKTAMIALDGSLTAAGDRAFDQAMTSFTNRIFGIVDSFINHLLHALDHDIGKCYPVWSLYDTILVENVCDSMVASLNGFWFALGWSLFFLLPTIVVATKLASHFRTMRLDESGNIFYDSQQSEMSSYPDEKGPPTFGSNKIAPSDTTDPQAGKNWWPQQ